MFKGREAGIGLTGYRGQFLAVHNATCCFHVPTQCESNIHSLHLVPIALVNLVKLNSSMS